MADSKSVLTDKDLSELHESFKNTPKSDVLSRIIAQNGVNQAAQDPNAQVRLNPVFSVDLQTGEVTNQKQSGRCWLFSLVNTLRHQFGAKYKVKNFNLSQKYLFFWDKIELANIFYDRILATASRPADDREVEAYLNSPDDDGGQWAMAAALVQKYGVVPVSDYPETSNENPLAPPTTPPTFGPNKMALMKIPASHKLMFPCVIGTGIMKNRLMATVTAINMAVKTTLKISLLTLPPTLLRSISDCLPIHNLLC